MFCSSQDQHQYLSLSNLRLRSSDSVWNRLVRPGRVCSYSEYCSTVGSVIWDYLYDGWYVKCTYHRSAHFNQLIKYPQKAQLSGLAFGLSVAGAIFLNLAQNQLTVLLPTIPKDQIQQFISGTSGALFHTLSPDDRHSALVILVDSLRTT